MFYSKANISARKARLKRLESSVSICPRKKLTLITSLLVLVLLILPLFPSFGDYSSVASANFDTGGSLAIDSQTFSLDELNTTEDGFLIKNTGQTSNVDRSELSDIITYTVESGDALSTIARRFGVSMDTIIWENNITDPHRLKPGTVLSILPVSGITHAVQSGDTLKAIADKYKIDVEKLAKQNQLKTDDKLIAGTKLIIPDGKKIISASPTYIASASSPGKYAAYTSPKALDGSIIVANGQRDKQGKWMIKPTNGIYTTYFQPGHWAVDIADRSAPPIHAAAAGTVVKSQCGWNGGYGCVIVIDHGDGYQTLYGHMSKLIASVGDAVDQGQEIGIMGHTGRVRGVTGIHLHFEVINKGVKKNPLAYYN